VGDPEPEPTTPSADRHLGGGEPPRPGARGFDLPAIQVRPGDLLGWVPET